MLFCDLFKQHKFASFLRGRWRELVVEYMEDSAPADIADDDKDILPELLALAEDNVVSIGGVNNTWPFEGFKLRKEGRPLEYY